MEIVVSVVIEEIVVSLAFLQAGEPHRGQGAKADEVTGNCGKCDNCGNCGKSGIPSSRRER